MESMALGPTGVSVLRAAVEASAGAAATAIARHPATKVMSAMARPLKWRNAVPRHVEMMCVEKTWNSLKSAGTCSPVMITTMKMLMLNQNLVMKDAGV
jgi:hypothetical protein